MSNSSGDNYWLATGIYNGSEHSLNEGGASESALIKKGKSNFMGKYKSSVCTSANVCKDTRVVIAGPGWVCTPGDNGLINMQMEFLVKPGAPQYFWRRWSGLELGRWGGVFCTQMSWIWAQFCF